MVDAAFDIDRRQSAFPIIVRVDILGVLIVSVLLVADFGFRQKNGATLRACGNLHCFCPFVWFWNPIQLTFFAKIQGKPVAVGRSFTTHV